MHPCLQSSLQLVPHRYSGLECRLCIWGDFMLVCTKAQLLISLEENYIQTIFWTKGRELQTCRPSRLSRVYCFLLIQSIITFGKGNSNPLHYSYLENFMHTGAGYSPWGGKDSNQLSGLFSTFDYCEFNYCEYDLYTVLHVDSHFHFLGITTED